MSRGRAEVVIHGRVQGVFFRQSTVDMARTLGINGWVRNCADGTVAAVFEGTRQAVEEAVAWCRQGPSAARVSDLELTWQEPREEFTDFRIRD
jgi:acylphosphatase